MAQSGPSCIEFDLGQDRIPFQCCNTTGEMKETMIGQIFQSCDSKNCLVAPDFSLQAKYTMYNLCLWNWRGESCRVDTRKKGFTDESLGYWITRMKNQLFPLCGSVMVLPWSQTNHLVGFQSLNNQKHIWPNSKCNVVWNTVTGSLLLYPFIFNQSG